MASIYGHEASQKCNTPSACTAVVELAVSSAGPFSFLMAFELPVSSEGIDSHLFFLPYGQEGWSLPSARTGFQNSLHGFKAAFQGPSAWRRKALWVAKHRNGFQTWEKLRALV